MSPTPRPDAEPDPVDPASGKPETPAPKSYDLGIAERRKVVRTLPAPLAVESDGDTDWDAFQALISDKPKS